MRQWCDFGALYLLLLLARPLPRGMLLAVGRGLGSLVWHVFRYRREVVLDNLAHAFSLDDDRPALHRLAHRFYRNLGMTLMEFLAMPRLDPTRVKSLVVLQGQEYLDEVARNGRGALLVSGHFGNWELLGARIAAEGLRVQFLVKTQSNQRVDRIQNGIRRQSGVGTIRTGESLKEMIKALRRGDLVGLLADQDAGRDGYFMEFLGRQASVFRGTAYFSWKFACPILTGFIFRQPDGAHVVRLNPPIYPDPAWDEATAVARLTAAHVARLSAAIRQAPEQYFWLHRRWKTRPPEADTG